MPKCIGAIDQGTTSTRFILFDEAGQEIAGHQLEHRQILPQPGWVEHDPEEIVRNTLATIQTTLRRAGIDSRHLAAVGLTNQRETTVVWNKVTGKPYVNAIVWQDTRTASLAARLESQHGQFLRQRTGLPPATYFSAPKLQWILQNHDEARAAAQRGDALFGTIDSWLLWNLTGGPSGGVHLTDVTNASRTQLMNLETAEWDPQLLELFQIPRRMLPQIRPSTGGCFGTTPSGEVFPGEVPVSGILGDQQAALVGQVCVHPGEAKNTYGTGNFLLLNTGSEIVLSKSGLLTTPAYQVEGEAPTFALEGSVAVTGSAVQWLRDQLGLISTSAQIEELANTVKDNGGVYFVPAFSGLFAPYWRSDARGVIVGLSRYADRGHLARATLESICFQTRDVLEAMTSDSGVRLGHLKVDGGATANDTLMQLQADVLGVEVIRPRVRETTALGAAYAAGLSTGFWKDFQQLSDNWKEDRRWAPRWKKDQREEAYSTWKRAVEKSLDWLQD